MSPRPSPASRALATLVPITRPTALLLVSALLGLLVLSPATARAQVGRRFPSEKKIVPDPVTGVPLEFLTSTPAGDSKIYQTHPQWTSDGKWIVFRSARVAGQAFAVNDDTGDIVQLTDKGYMGMLCLARHSMTLYLMRDEGAPAAPDRAHHGRARPHGPFQIVAVDLGALFADTAKGTVKGGEAYERVCGTTPAGLMADGNMGLDANEDFMYFRVSGDEVARRLPTDEKPAATFGPRGMGAGPTGLASMNLKTGEVKPIVTVPFQIGHVQTNPWVPGEIVFCWETGGKAPTRMWTVRSDGTGLRPLYPEQPFEWITHEAVITRDEVAFTIIALYPPVTPDHPLPPQLLANFEAWGRAGGADHPTGAAVVNLRTHAMRIVGQVPFGDPGRSFWHINGSADGRWLAVDDFQYRTWIIDRHTGERMLLADNGHKTTAADHQHPTFNADGTKIEIQSAMLSANGRSLNICVIPVPPAWLARTYPERP